MRSSVPRRARGGAVWTARGPDWSALVCAARGLDPARVVQTRTLLKHARAATADSAVRMLYTKVLAPACGGAVGARAEPARQVRIRSDTVREPSEGQRARHRATCGRGSRRQLAPAAAAHPGARALPPLAHHPFALALLGALAAAPARLLPPLAGAAVFFLGAFVSC